MASQQDCALQWVKRWKKKSASAREKEAKDRALGWFKMVRQEGKKEDWDMSFSNGADWAMLHNRLRFFEEDEVRSDGVELVDMLV
jgi:hypothetical protein